MRSLLPLFALAARDFRPGACDRGRPGPAFRSVELRGGGDVTIVPGPAQRVTILVGQQRLHQHSSRSATASCEIDACNERCPHNYRPAHPHRDARACRPSRSTAAARSDAAGGFAPQRQLAAAVNGGGTIDLRAVDARERLGRGEWRRRHCSSVRARPCRPQSTAAATSAISGNPQVIMAVRGGGDVSRGELSRRQLDDLRTRPC